MTCELFYEYIANIFHPILVSQVVIFPVVLFVDGHKSYLTYQLSQSINLFHFPKNPFTRLLPRGYGNSQNV